MHTDSFSSPSNSASSTTEAAPYQPVGSDLDVLFAVSRALHRCDTHDALCTTLVEATQSLLSCDQCAVFIGTDSHMVLRGRGGLAQQPVALQPHTLTVALDRQVIENLVAPYLLRLPHVAELTPAMRDMLDLGLLPPEPASLYAFALRSVDQVLGVVACTFAQPLDLPTQRIRALEMLLDEAALALDRLRAREELRERAEELERTRALVDATNDAILLLDDQGRATLVNRRAKFFFGISEDDVLGKDYERLQELFTTIFEAPQQFAGWLAPLLHAERERAVHEFQTLRPARRLLQCFTAPVRTYPSAPEDMASRLLGRLLVFRDITREREVDRMKNDFVSTVSHELRTPLTSIRGALQLVLGQPMTVKERGGETRRLPDNGVDEPPPAAQVNLSPRARELLGVSLTNTERLIRLINDMLDVAKIEQGRIQLQREPLDPAMLCQIAQAEVAGLASVRDIGIGLELPDQLPLVHADRDRTVQVLTNLLSNAIKFSSPGQRVLLAAGFDMATAMVRFAVRDWGRGIAPQDQQRLFQPFQQLDSSTTRAVGGTGLGLAICKSLVHEHGGAIWVESALGYGSTFFFTLPLGPQTEQSSAESPEPQVNEKDTSPSGAQQAIVVQRQDTARARQNYARFVHLFSSPLTSLHGALTLIRHRPAMEQDALVQTLLGAADRSLERIKQAAALLQEHALFDEESISITIPDSRLPGAHVPDQAPSSQVEPASASAEETSVAPQSTEDVSSHAPGIVLLVVDEDDAQLLMQLLQQDGHKLLLAGNTAESIDAARKHRPDLIVLDLDHPAGQDAYAAQVLREDPETKLIPVVYLVDGSGQPTRLPSHATALPKTAAPAELRMGIQAAIASGRARNGHLKTILIVDDETDISQLLAKELEGQGYRTVEVSSGTEALLRAQQQPFDLIILDLMLPDIDGFAVLGGLRARAQTALTPIILLSALNAPQEKVQGLQLGADDYVTKPFVLDELSARMSAAMRRSELEGSANPSTRLPGNIAIERAISRRIEQGQPFAVCYCDLDNFKAYNDAYGFLKGDAVIHQTAHVLVTAVERSGNPDDFVGHIGGDDFVVVTTPERLSGVCEAALHTFDTLAPLFYDAPTRERGYIASVDRKGQPAEFPLVSLSIAVVTNTHTPIQHLAEVAQRAIDLKKQAKYYEGSVYVVDDDPSARRVDPLA